MLDKIIELLELRVLRGALSGTAAIEFGMMTPLLVGVALGVVDYGNMLVQQAALEGATRAGAEYARASGEVSPWTTTQSQVTGFMNFAPVLNAFDCASGHSCITTVCTCVDGNAPIGGTCAGTCSVGTPPDTRVLKYVSVKVTQNFSPLVSYTGFLFPSSLSAGTVTRIQ
jgi:Flp pilus assembly protein TadG